MEVLERLVDWAVALTKCRSQRRQLSRACHAIPVMPFLPVFEMGPMTMGEVYLDRATGASKLE